MILVKTSFFTPMANLELLINLTIIIYIYDFTWTDLKTKLWKKIKYPVPGVSLGSWKEGSLTLYTNTHYTVVICECVSLCQPSRYCENKEQHSLSHTHTQGPTLWAAIGRLRSVRAPWAAAKWRVGRRWGWRTEQRGGAAREAAHWSAPAHRDGDFSKLYLNATLHVPYLRTEAGWEQLTSVFSDRPLLKKMSETAMYATVTSGFKGPDRGKQIKLSNVIVCVIQQEAEAIICSL